MPTVLLTGSAGLVGTAVEQRLAADGWDVRPFDLAGGHDLRDEAAVREAASGCDAIVHAGAIPHDSKGTPADILAVNVLGTWHVLLAAEHHGIDRVVYFSSAQVFGFAEGEGEPLFVPVDDTHPARAERPYGMSKRLAEDMCAAWSGRTGHTTVVLRPVAVLDDARLRWMRPERADMRAFVHVDDVASAVALALTADVGKHVRLTLASAGQFDTSAAREALGWQPTRDWPRRSLLARVRGRLMPERAPGSTRSAVRPGASGPVP